jgi:hypothetical protein
MPDPRSSAAAGRRMAGPPLDGIFGDGEPETVCIIVVPWANAIGARTSMARRAAIASVARKVALFIQSSFCLLYLSSGLHLSSPVEKLPTVYRIQTQKSSLF